MSSSPVTALPVETVDVDALESLFRDGDPLIGVIGLGYVGLPLVRAFADRKMRSLGFDVDPEKVSALNAGRSYIKHIPNETVTTIRDDGLFEATADFERVGEPDAILICVPTPLNRYREPDLSYVENTATAIAPFLRPGQLVILESTTYPGTTEEVMKPILEAHGLVCGRNLFLAYSPEREDPGNEKHHTAIIPKVVGGDGPDAQRLAVALYDRIVVQTVPVSTTQTAEAVKLTENIFRAVNIALVNELKVIYERMGVDVWEVIEAAKTKPFGFMPFYPGPGLGGHCIPIDPFYLTWKAREHETPTRFIELAGEINTAMPRYVVDRLVAALSDRHRQSINGARILLLGVAYKKNVDDQRSSPAMVLIDLMEGRGATVAFHDPYVAELHRSREHPHLGGRRSVDLQPDSLSDYDAVLICTDHDGVDYATIVANSRLVVDTRNATRGLPDPGGVVVRA